MLTEGHPVGDVAAACGVSARTVHRWRSRPSFRALLRDTEEGCVDDLGRRIGALVGPALRELGRILESRRASPAAKVAAAACVLEAARSERG